MPREDEPAADTPVQVAKAVPEAASGTGVGRALPAPGGSSREAGERVRPSSPSFDIVRIRPSGEAVIAGRAEPHATVEVTDGERVLGQVRADRRGEWALVPEKRLTPGAREIGIVSTGADGAVSESDSVVVVDVPEVGAAAVPKSGEVGSAFAVLVPRRDVRPSRVLQRPESSVVDGGAQREARATVRIGEDPAGDKPVKIASIGPSHESASQSVVEEGPAAPGGLSVETIDYDQAGQVALSGTADPGAQVNVYLDERKIGEARADTVGRWEMTPAEDVAPGRYTLRADQLATEGGVAARIRLPFSRAEAFGDLPPGTLVVVQPGNSLWRIARRTYGEGERYTLIYRANQRQIDDPDLIYPGQVFSLPEAERAENESR